jgi:hypothetical protein
MSPCKLGPAAAALALAAMMTALIGCSASNHPAAESTTSTAAPASAPPAPKSVRVDTLDVGSTGVRCFIGNTSFACVANARPMTLGQLHAWSAVGADAPPGNLEPGFTPGALAPQPAVGDVAFIDASSCNSAPGHTQPGATAAPMVCRSINLTSTIRDTDTDILVGVISRVGAADLTIRFTESEMTIPLPEAPASVFYRPSPGQQLTPDQPVKIRKWTFSLHGDTLTIAGPNGPTDIGVR